MSKRSRKKNRPAHVRLSLETLERRELLATITAGNGTEVASNIKAANGNVYDQILLTGASISVKADPGEIVRISFLDLNGDIVQTEFSGTGTLSLDLADFRVVGSSGYVNANPDQILAGKKIDYVQGLASITFTNPDVSSNLGVFSAGIVTNPGLFAGQPKQGGNNIADIAQIVLVGDTANAAGYSNFGGIRAGNVTFSASSGTVGIRAEKVAVQSIVAIGDIDAQGAGVPTLLFHPNSQFQTVFVRGGDLAQTNQTRFSAAGAGGGATTDTMGGFSFFSSTDGTTSRGIFQPALPLDQKSFLGFMVPQQLAVSGDWTFDWSNIQSVKVTKSGIDVSSTYGGDWLVNGVQNALNYAFDRKAYSGNITIVGDLPGGLDLTLADAKSITFENNLLGRLIVDGAGASLDALTVKGNLEGKVLVRGLDWTNLETGLDRQKNFIGALTVHGSTGSSVEIRAEEIGDVLIAGNFSGLVSTNVAPEGGNAAADNTWNGSPGASALLDFDGSIGNVSIGFALNGSSNGGSILNGTIQGMSGIGNVKIAGDIAGSPVGTGVFVTASNPAALPGDTANIGSASIGTIRVDGDVALTASNQRLVHIAGNGTFGNIVVSGNGKRGDLDGSYNRFGRIEVAGLLPAGQTATGLIAWTDSVDQDFGGVILNSNGATSASVPFIGAISLASAKGAKTDLLVSGVIGSSNAIDDQGHTNPALVGLTGFQATGFEDVTFGQIDAAQISNNVIRATEIKEGLAIVTVPGTGEGSLGGAISPAVRFASTILLGKGTVDAGNKNLFTIDTGPTNSSIQFDSGAGVVVTAIAPADAHIGAINFSADTVSFAGTLSSRTIDAISFTGGKGIASASSTGVQFTGKIIADTFGGFSGASSSGDVVFAPLAIDPQSSSTTKALVGPIALTTAGNNHGGDISFGAAGAIYKADFGDIGLTAGHKLFVSQPGVVASNPGNITINFATAFAASIGNLTASTTSGTITDTLLIGGNAGAVAYKAGTATVDSAAAASFTGQATDLVRFGSIVANQTIWGNRGLTSLEVAGQKADGSASTADIVVQNTSHKMLPSGSISATLNYAGAATGAGNAFVARSGAGAIALNYNVVSHDDNLDGKIAVSELGQGGNVDVSSISGDLQFFAATQLPDFTTASSLGNVSLKTGTYAQTSGLITGADKGDIALRFTDILGINGLPAPQAIGFEGNVGNIVATTTAGDIAFYQSRFDGNVGNVTLTSGAVVHSGGVIAGNILTTTGAGLPFSPSPAAGVVFNGSHGLTKASVTDVGTVKVAFTSNAAASATSGYQFNSEQGGLTAVIAADRFDTNNDGLIAAGEYGRTGTVTLVSKGGTIDLSLYSTTYLSTTEQSSIGPITISNNTFIDAKAGATDGLGAGKTALGSSFTGANGDIVISGRSNAAIGNLVATTDAGTITQRGTFGDTGTATLTTSAYFDTDSLGSVTNEAPLLLASGKIQLGNGLVGSTYDIGPDAFPNSSDDQGSAFDVLTVSGKHGLATYKTTEDGIISGAAYLGGSASGADSIKASSDRGDISLGLWLQDVDRRGLQPLSTQYGALGTVTISTGAGGVNSGGGDIVLKLGTNQNAPAVLGKNLIPQFVFGAIVATVNDRYTTISNSAPDVLADAGKITISGVGADAIGSNSFGTIAGNRGSISSITATARRGSITETGDFGSVGQQALTTTRYLDTLNGTDAEVFAGNIVFNPSLWGSHGTATIRIDDSGATGAGATNAGNITGQPIFGGSHTDTVAIDAKNGVGSIDLKISSRGYDLNADGKIGDSEFASVGNTVLETTMAGDVTLALVTTTVDGSKTGSAIGDIVITADDDNYKAVSNAPDTVVDLANVTVIGQSQLPLIAGKVGGITIKTNTGAAVLQGNFVDLGSVTIASGSYTDTSDTLGASSVQAAGKIQLGTANATGTSLADTGILTTLNIAGKSSDSTFTAPEMGTISGSVYGAGAGGGNWAFVTGSGAINLDFIAGFDADGSGGALAASEAGSLANVSATSAYGNVTLGLGARAATSAIGNVSAITGQKVTAVAGATDTFVAGNVSIISRNGSSGRGSIGDILGQVATGTVSFSGTFGNVGAISFLGDAYVDTDFSASVIEDPIVIKAGDIVLNSVIWGTHGTMTLTTVDASKVYSISSVVPLAAGQSTVPTVNKMIGSVLDLGTVTGTAVFSGGLAAGVTAGIVAKTDRGLINVKIDAGLDENADLAMDAGEGGDVGNISFTSTDGSIVANFNVLNTASSIGNVTAVTGSTWKTQDSAFDTQVVIGDITLTSANAGLNGQNYGTIGNVVASVLDGIVKFNGTYNNLGTVTLGGGKYVDTDTIAGGTEPAATIGAGDIVLNATVRGSHNTFTLTTIDNASGGAAINDTGTISASLTVTGPLAAGTKSLVASTQQGAITASITATTHLNIADTKNGQAADDLDVNGVPLPGGATNSDDRVGAAGNIELTSLFNNVTATLLTSAPVAKSADPTDVVRTPSIGNVSVSTGSSYTFVAAAPDTLVLAGIAQITTQSDGQIGNISSVAGTGNTFLTGTLNNLVGNISLTGGQYVDGDTAPGAGESPVVVAAGSISHNTQYATSASTSVGTISLQATGTIANDGASGAAGNVIDSSTWNSQWTDANANNTIDVGELTTVVFAPITATVTDGALHYIPMGTGPYGSKFDRVTLQSTGTSTWGSTGLVSLEAKGVFSQITNVTATAATGNVLFQNAMEAPVISNLTLRSLGGNGATPAGDVIFSGSLNLGLPNEIGSRTRNVSISDVTLKADNGNVTLSGSIGENIHYNALNFITATGAADNRTATIANLVFSAANGAADSGATDGNIAITGRIGGTDITRIDGLTLTSSNKVTDSVTFSNIASSNVEAWQMGSITVNGTTTFSNTGAATNIKADDSLTTRTLNGALNYSVASTLSTAGKGSALNKIDALTFNGTVIGASANSLKTGAVAEVMASQFGTLTINAVIDPNSSVLFSSVDFDVSANPMDGEYIAQKASVAAATGYKTLDQYSFGTLSIVHGLSSQSTGTAIFSGSNAFSAGGRIDNLSVTSVASGSVQAPLFLPSANASAWFTVGDINGSLGTANTTGAIGGKTTNGAAVGFFPVGAVSVGNVTVNAASSYTPPAVQKSDISHAGGGTGGGFAVAVGVDVNAAGNYYSSAGLEAVLIDPTRTLYGRIETVTVSNGAIRPDNFNIGAEPAVVAAPGAIVVAGDGLAAVDIGDVTNELTGGAIRPLGESQYYLVGDDDGGNNSDGDDVIVYVI